MRATRESSHRGFARAKTEKPVQFLNNTQDRLTLVPEAAATGGMSLGECRPKVRIGGGAPAGR